MLSSSIGDIDLVGHVFRTTGSKNEVLEAESAVDILLSSGLTPGLLAEIWCIADAGGKGSLTRDELTVTLRLVGWAQRGVGIRKDLGDHDSPLASLKSLDLPLPFRRDPKEIQFPPLSAHNKRQYRKIFDLAGGNGDSLSGENAWRWWIKSGFSCSTLTAMWDLVDERKDGTLRFPEFCLSMYLMHGLLDGTLSELPLSLPPELRDEAYDRSTDSTGQSPIAQPHVVATNPFMAECTISRTELKNWNLSPSFLQYAERKFKSLTAAGDNVVHGDVVGPFFLRSNLAENVLSALWELTDPMETGSLSRRRFSIALFLVFRALFGLDIPQVLPPSLSLLRVSVVVPCSGVPEKEHEPPPVPTKDDAVGVSEAETTSDIPIPKTPTLPPKPEEYKPETSVHGINALQTECQRMKSTLAILGRENEFLRSSLQETQHLQSELDEARMQIGVESGRVEKLRSKVQDRDKRLSQLQKSSAVGEQVKQENITLHLQVEDLSEKLRNSLAEFEVQRLVQDELRAETKRLQRQLHELRDSVHLPSAGGDEDLQMLINENISRENSRLRVQVQELSDSVSQLQAVSEERDAQRQTERVLARENQRLRRRVRQLEGDSVETQTQLRRRVEELTGESRQLRQELETERARSQARHSGRRRRSAEDILPPAYEEIDTA